MLRQPPRLALSDDHLSISDPLPIPLSLSQVQRAISHEGGLERVRCLLDKLAGGGNVTIAVLGGSVSAGSSSRVRPDQSGALHTSVVPESGPTQSRT